MVTVPGKAPGGTEAVPGDDYHVPEVILSVVTCLRGHCLAEKGTWIHYLAVEGGGQLGLGMKGLICAAAVVPFHADHHNNMCMSHVDSLDLHLSYPLSVICYHSLWHRMAVVLAAGVSLVAVVL